MDQSYFQVSPNPPIVIMWDKVPFGIQYAPTFCFAIGLNPIKVIDISSGTPILIRPELRFKANDGKILGSIISEYELDVYFLKNVLPNEFIIMDYVKHVYNLFGEEFFVRTGQRFVEFVNPFPEKEVMEAIRNNMKNSGWL
jgi:hypothetical protein